MKSFAAGRRPFRVHPCRADGTPGSSRRSRPGSTLCAGGSRGGIDRVADQVGHRERGTDVRDVEHRAASCGSPSADMYVVWLLERGEAAHGVDGEVAMAC